jgi:D-alanyl-D-alanine carboxypeptidase
MLAQADDDLRSFLQQTLGAARDKYHVPGIAALIQIDARIAAEAAVGIRALGHPEAVTVDDRWHIGSDTKAFTSMMIARLVEQRALGWDDTLAASFPPFSKEINPAYRDVSVTQLLSHTAGLPPLTADKDQPPFLAVIKTAHGVGSQRAAIARKYLSMAPASKPGEFEYSNLGYIIAGAIAESRTGKTWEDLVREQIFAPLGITSAGFGVPGTSGKFDEPRGHREIAGKLTQLDPADSEADNPPALGPAGTINITLKDWMRFAQDQLDGLHSHGKLLKAETYRKLHTPVTGVYALGWGAKIEPDGSTSVLTHTGSNGYWLADVSIMPKHDIIVLITMNSGNEGANEAIRDIGKSLRDRLKPFD